MKKTWRDSAAGRRFSARTTGCNLSRDPIAENTTAPRPVFIVGFPRSGTSLLEQILGSHPAIAPAGELVFISDLANHAASTIIGSKLEYPACLLDRRRTPG